MNQETMMKSELLHAIYIGKSDDIIEHFGVKGMKWGFRKQRSKWQQKRKMKKQNKANAAAWNRKFNNRSVMTSKDLKEATNRLRLENDFAEQMRRSKQLGKKSIGDKLKKAGGFVGSTVANVALTTVTNDLLKSSPSRYSPLTKSIVNIGRN